MNCYHTTYHKLWYLLFPIILLFFGSVQAQVQTQVEYHSSRTNEAEDRTSITVSKPTGVQAGDFLLVAIANSRGDEVKGVKPPDNGWILIEKTDAGSNFGVISFYKIAGSSEPSSYEFKFYRNVEMTLTRSGTYAIGISRFSGVDPNTPFQVVAENAATSRGRNVVAPSVTTLYDDSYVLVLFGIDQEDGFESSDTFLRLYTKDTDKIVASETDGLQAILDDDDDDDDEVSLMLGWFNQALAGSTGTRTARSDEDSGWWAAQTLALKAAGSAPEDGRYTSNDPEQNGNGTAEAPFLFMYGTPIGPLSPIFDGGDAPTSYTISTSTACQLPTGLSLSATTGVISGTPLITVVGCAITVVAANDYGSTTILVYITVVPRPLTIGGAFTANDKLYDGNRSATFASNTLQLVNVYGSDDVQLTNIIIEFDDAEVVDVDQPVRITSASLTGAQASFYTLSLVGAPTTEAMITTLNPPVGGRYESDDPEQTGDGSQTRAFIFTVGEDIGNLNPIFSGGGAPTAFEISDETACPLPSGLSLNPTTGVISGTPLVVIELCAVTVIASNDDGSTTITVYITVLPAAVPGGSVSGLVFGDFDASGIKESSETGFEGVTVRLYSGSNLLMTTTSDNEGAYTFMDVPVGSYTLNIVLPADHYESIPGPDIGGSYNVTIASEQVLTDYDFGIFPEAAVFGYVYIDNNNKISSVFGLNSDLPPGITISGVRTGPAPQKTSTILNSSGNQILLSSFTIEVDENGYFEEHLLVPGEYLISVEVPAPWVVTTTNPVDIFVGVDFMVEVDFGIIEEEVQRDESVIMGYVSASDVMAPPAKIGTDIPTVMLEGIRVELSGKSTTDEIITKVTFTDAKGMYAFTDLPAGNYVVEIKPVKAYSYDWPMHQKHAIRLGNSAATGSVKGDEKVITTVEANTDRGMALVSILIDTNLDGKGDRRVDLTTDWSLELKGLPSQNVRALGLESMGGLGYNKDGSRLNGLLMRTTAGGTLERLNTTDARVAFTSGFILEHNESYLMSDENLQWTSISKTWPIREEIFTLNQGVNIRDPFGRLMGRILAAELRPMNGVDFNLEYADFGDADQSYGTLRAKVTDEATVLDRHIFYPVDGARHLLPLRGDPMLYLGTSVAVDLDGLPFVLANRSTDDDGVVLPDSTAQADTAKVAITLVGSGLLSAWVDWNQNGRFESDEIALRDIPVMADAEGAAQIIDLVVPETALVGTTTVRFRLTSQAGVGANGLAKDGEVEDYLFIVTKAAGDGDDDDGGGPTSDPRDGTVPGEYGLGHNYPNPFNPSTMIPFELAQSGQVTIGVYDMTGRLVRTLVDQVMSAGRHSVSFNASGIPSGVYVVRMSAGGQVLTGKLALVK